MKTHSELILNGGLVLNMPGNMLDPGQATILENWQVEQNGALRARTREATLYDNITQAGNIFYQSVAGGARYYAADGSHIYINGTSEYTLAGNPNAEVVWFADYKGYVWCMSRLNQLRSDGFSFFPWLESSPVHAPTASGSYSGTPSGTYTYAYSFVTADGIETNLSPTSAPVTVTNQAISISGMDVAAQTTVVNKWIYRSGGTQSSANPLRVGIVSNATTTFTDTMSDNQAESLDIEHTQDHDPPPACYGMAGPDAWGHLVAWADNPQSSLSRVFWSKSGTPWYWPGSGRDQGNWIDVGDKGDLIVSVTMKPNMWIIYKRRSIWRLVNDPDTNYSILEPISLSNGASGNRVASSGTIDYFLSGDGVYSCDGDAVKKVSTAIDQCFRADANFYDDGNPNYAISTDPVICLNSSLAVHRNRVYLTYPDSTSGGSSTRTLVMDATTGRWAQDSRGWYCLYSSSELPGFGLLGALTGGALCVVDDQSSTPVSVHYRSRYIDFGAPDMVKSLEDIRVEYDIESGGSLSVNLSLDNGDNTQSLGTITGGTDRTSAQFTVPLDLQCRNVALEIIGSVPGDALIYAFHMRARVEQRDASVYDSGIIDLGSGDWKQVSALSLDINNPANIEWSLFADSGGNGMMLVENGIIPGVGARQGVRVAVGENLPTILYNGLAEGRLFRLVLQNTVPGATFRLYGAQMLTRKIGAFLVPGEELGLLPNNLGSSRLKLMRRIEIDCEGGQYTLNVQTDMPGNALAQRYSGIGPITGRRFDSYYLPTNTRGRFVMPRLEATGVLRVYKLRLWYKLVGEAESSAWQWFDFPIAPTGDIFTWAPLEVDN